MPIFQAFSVNLSLSEKSRKISGRFFFSLHHHFLQLFFFFSILFFSHLAFSFSSELTLSLNFKTLRNLEKRKMTSFPCPSHTIRKKKRKKTYAQKKAGRDKTLRRPTSVDFIRSSSVQQKEKKYILPVTAGTKTRRIRRYDFALLDVRCRAQIKKTRTSRLRWKQAQDFEKVDAPQSEVDESKR